MDQVKIMEYTAFKNFTWSSLEYFVLNKMSKSKYKEKHYFN